MKFPTLRLIPLLTASFLWACSDDAPLEPELIGTLAGHAVLPAATFADGPPSGARIGPGPINDQAVPFDGQPVGGLSALLSSDDGTFWAVTDSGFGSLERSADFHLRVYRIRPSLRAPGGGGDGSIEVLEHIELRDPDRKIPFAITNHFTEDRVLTGADFDIESMQRAPDGTLWFGDAFGPFLLHTSAEGVVLDAPIELPDIDNPGRLIRSPQNPYNEEAAAVRIMNAVRRHAELHQSARTPVFSPYHVMLAYPGSDDSMHFARGDNPQEGLTEAASDVFSIPSLQAAGYPVVTWTVNDKERMLELLAQGVDGIITDRPDLLLEALTEFDANGDGQGGDFLTEDGLIDGDLFDAQGHRGARDLRPENTLPAMEAALDHLMVTLETDTGVTSDAEVVLNHDPYVQADKCRRADGIPYHDYDQATIKELTLAELQATFICDRVFRGDEQRNDRELSPVSVLFAGEHGLMDPYVMPTLAQLFAFVDAYIDYYQVGAGMDHPDAERRWQNASIVRFNIETKLNPRSDFDRHGNVYSERTIGPEPFADAVAGLIVAHGLEERADVQSFDFRTLLHVQAGYPDIRTVYLFGDFPIYESDASDDGTNLQDEDGANTPWLAGLHWPYRSTVRTQPFRAQTGGGFQGMALSADGGRLLPMLAKPLDAVGNELLIHVFDLAERAFTVARHRYLLDSSPNAPHPFSHSIGDFVMLDDAHGLVIERDSTEGQLDAYKAIHRITLRDSGVRVAKQPLVDLLDLRDPDAVGIGSASDLGVGNGVFALPFMNIESLVVLGPQRIAVLNDNNFPFSVGRHLQAGLPDDTELIVIDLSGPLVP